LLTLIKHAKRAKNIHAFSHSHGDPCEIIFYSRKARKGVYSLYLLISLSLYLFISLSFIFYLLSFIFYLLSFYLSLGDQGEKII